MTHQRRRDDAGTFPPEPLRFSRGRHGAAEGGGEAEARRALAVIARSGTSIREWARAHRIDGRSLHAWDLVLSRKVPRRASPRAAIVELLPVPAARVPARYVMRLGDVAIEFGDDAQEETLRRVLGVLRSC